MSEVPGSLTFPQFATQPLVERVNASEKNSFEFPGLMLELAPQRPEEFPDLFSKNFRLFQCCEMTSSWHVLPTVDIEYAFNPAARWHG